MMIKIFLDLTACVTDKYLAGFVLFSPPVTSRPLYKAASRVVPPLPLPPLPYHQPRHVAGPPGLVLRRVAALTSLP